MTDVHPPALFGPEFDADPYPAYAWLRQNQPVHRIDLPGGAWAYLVTRYTDAKQALADPRLVKDLSVANPTWRAAELGLPLDHRPSLAQHLLNVDAADHARVRRLIVGAFTPRRSEKLRSTAQRVTDGLLDQIVDKGSADLIRDLAYPLPITMICELLGVPESEREEFHRHAAVIDSASASDTEEIRTATDGLDTYIRKLVAGKQREPTDDLLSDLVAHHSEGTISEDELTSTAFLLLVAGHETTVSLIGNGMLTLLSNPERLAEVVADRSLLPSVVEEVIRFDGPVQNATWRFASEPVQLGADEQSTVQLERGDPVLIALLSANRDPEQFSEADQFLPTRASGHLGFGHGPHFCAGAALARMEGQVAYESVLQRMPDLRLACAPEQLTWWPSAIMHGLYSLPVEFTPSRAR